jgi:TonB-dependent starch-binding outer membrane protein SusC
MQKIIYALATIILLAAFALPPGTTTVIGKVMDETRNPIPYATVQEKGTKNGVSCKGDGSFSIRVRSTKSILRAQATGYSTMDCLIIDTLSLTLVLKLAPKTCYNRNAPQQNNLATTVK